MFGVNENFSDDDGAIKRLIEEGWFCGSCDWFYGSWDCIDPCIQYSADQNVFLFSS